jgi:hypothetical protein
LSPSSNFGTCQRIFNHPTQLSKRTLILRENVSPTEVFRLRRGHAVILSATPAEWTIDSYLQGPKYPRFLVTFDVIPT